VNKLGLFSNKEKQQEQQQQQKTKSGRQGIDSMYRKNFSQRVASGKMTINIRDRPCPNCGHKKSFETQKLEKCCKCRHVFKRWEK
jgi:NADH pyrophosphatase NudC (nudix superfamily)